MAFETTNAADKIEIITNATDVKAENIPQSTINDIADILYNIFARTEAKQTVAERATAV